MKKDPKLLKLGEKIREVRKAHGFSQEAIASESGVDRSYMGSVERGERNIAALNLIKIAQALNVEIGDLFPPLENFKNI